MQQVQTTVGIFVDILVNAIQCLYESFDGSNSREKCEILLEIIQAEESDYRYNGKHTTYLRSPSRILNTMISAVSIVVFDLGASR